MWTVPARSCLVLLVAVLAVPATQAESLSAELRVGHPSVWSGSHSAVKRSARVNSFQEIPDTTFSCAAQDSPGIFADQDTGCQVFHYCQPGGRVDSFFCPNLTLFNQQYFVCDWEYNVDCGQAARYYPLNKDIFSALPSSLPYLPSALPALPALPAQTDLLGAASSSEVSRTLTSLVSQLGGRSSGLVVDQSPPQLHLTQHQQPLLAPVTPVLHPVQHPVLHPVQHPVLHPVQHGATSLTQPGNALPLAAGSLPLGLSSGGPYARQGYAAGPSALYAGPSALPAGPSALPAGPSALPAGPSALPAAPPSLPTAPSSLSSYDDAVADPEPYPGATPTALAAAGLPIPVAPVTIADVVADPKSYSAPAAPAAALAQSYTAGSTTYDDAVADPEPYPGATPAALAAAGLPLPYSALPIPAVVPVPAPAVAYDDAVADPEPYPGATPAKLLAAGLALPYYPGQPTTAYQAGGTADPEPAPAAPQYYTDFADPEPLATKSLAPAAPYTTSASYDDSPADPEPDPSSYRADPASYPSYSAGNAIQAYFTNFPSQGPLVLDSPDPEPAADPEFTS